MTSHDLKCMFQRSSNISPESSIMGYKDTFLNVLNAETSKQGQLGLFSLSYNG